MSKKVVTGVLWFFILLTVMAIGAHVTIGAKFAGPVAICSMVLGMITVFIGQALFPDDGAY